MKLWHIAIKCNMAVLILRAPKLLQSTAQFLVFQCECVAVLTLCETGFASRGLTQDRGTANTQHHCLSMAEHCRDLVAA